MRGVVPLLALAALPAWGGTVYMTFNQHATQNLFQTRDAVSDRISGFSLAIDQDLSALSLLARVEYSAFQETSGLSSFAADIGLDYLAPSGRKSAFYFAAGGAGQFYRQTYGSFSSLGANLLGAFKTYLAPSSILKLHWQGQYSVYRDSLFDFLSHKVSLSIDKYFPSQTTLKADAEWGYKYFLHPFLPELTLEPAVSESMTALTGGSGTGGPAETGLGGSAAGAGWGGQHYQGGEGFVPRYSSSGGGAGIGHVSVSLLAAQGIGDVVGLSVSALRQWTVAGQNPFVSVEEFYFVQNPSADSFSWEGDQLTGRISLNIPWDITLKTGYTYSDKTYPGVESMSLDGVPLGLVRNDRRHLLEARLQKDFRRLSVFVAYSYVDNTSTDPLFVWKSHFITGGFEWNLPAGRRKGGA
ncbi:MAG: hypothetical protein ACXWGZ_04005 [Candidatus Aminicenantales bacterium]